MPGVVRRPDPHKDCLATTTKLRPSRHRIHPASWVATVGLLTIMGAATVRDKLGNYDSPGTSSGPVRGGGLPVTADQVVRRYGPAATRAGESMNSKSGCPIRASQRLSLFQFVQLLRVTLIGVQQRGVNLPQKLSGGQFGQCIRA